MEADSAAAAFYHRSPHYADQLSAWLRGELRAMRFQSLAGGEAGGALHLVPGGCRTNCVSAAPML
jgi:hypothetical protein